METVTLIPWTLRRSLETALLFRSVRPLCQKTWISAFSQEKNSSLKKVFYSQSGVHGVFWTIVFDLPVFVMRDRSQPSCRLAPVRKERNGKEITQDDMEEEGKATSHQNKDPNGREGTEQCLMHYSKRNVESSWDAHSPYSTCTITDGSLQVGKKLIVQVKKSENLKRFFKKRKGNTKSIIEIGHETKLASLLRT